MSKIKLLGNLHCIDGVAVSGGPDSMALLGFLRKGHHNPKAFFFDHKTSGSKEARKFLLEYCDKEKIPLVIGDLKGSKPKRESWEEFWRNKRYSFLHKQKCMIATAHHLNDVAETYVWGIANGRTRYIHYCKPINDGPSNIIRPFLLTPKGSLVDWCHNNSIPFIIDPSNTDVMFARNRIRHRIIPELEMVNPGFLKVIKKVLLRKLEADKRRNWHATPNSV